MKRILIVDDDEPFRRILRETLRLAGYVVTTAENGAVALRLFRQEPVDLVMTDLIMPEKEGIETILELLRLQVDLKIIAMSGGGCREAGDYLPIARHLGASEVLTKPFTAQDLMEAVETLLACPCPSVSQIPTAPSSC